MFELISVIFMFVPLWGIMWVANLAESNRQEGERAGGLALLSYLLAGGIYAFAILMGVLIQLSSNLTPEQLDVLREAGLDPSNNPLLTDSDSLLLLGMGIWLAGLLGIILLLPFVRRSIATLIPSFDSRSPVHAVGISFISLIVIQLIFILGVGLGNLAAAMEAQAELTGETDGGVAIGSLWVQQICTLVLAMIGVGWLVRRGWGDTMRRLGITSLTGEQIGFGVGLGIALVPVVMILEFALNALFGITADPDVEALTEQLLGSLFTSPIGILTLGLAAALGEEPIFRGAAQPRFGLILTAALFAIVHSNYGISLSTLIVFLLGLVLGIVRIRHNTSTSMIVHAVYNISLGILAYVGASFLDNF